MKLKKIAENLTLKVITSIEGIERDVTGGYVSDLLSDVMANSKDGNLWITLQTHINIVAVASLKNLSGIVIVNGRTPDSETVNKANSENIPLLLTDKSAFKVAGELYQLLYA